MQRKKKNTAVHASQIIGPKKFKRTLQNDADDVTSPPPVVDPVPPGSCPSLALEELVIKSFDGASVALVLHDQVSGGPPLAFADTVPP